MFRKDVSFVAKQNTDAHKLDPIQENHRNKLLQSPHAIKFIVVRHPLTRFVGSWDDIFCAHCQLGHELIEKHTSLAQMTEADSDDEEYMISLPNLVDFAVQDRRWVLLSNPFK